MMKSENINPMMMERMTDEMAFAALIHSPLADREGIDNTPPAAARNMLHILLHEALRPIERLTQRPLHVVSGYRSVTLNRLVKGRKHSHHIIGCAADISVGSRTENRHFYRELRRLAREHRLRLTALEHEPHYRWIHIAYVPTMIH